MISIKPNIAGDPMHYVHTRRGALDAVSPPAAVSVFRSQVPDWSISIVSHCHIAQVRLLLQDLDKQLNRERVEILLTLNTEESSAGLNELWRGRLVVIRNEQRRGFSANHNTALRIATGRFFAVLDPELRLQGNPFTDLEELLKRHTNVLAAPSVSDSSGNIQDNARELLTPLALLRRYTTQRRARTGADVQSPREVAWIAGLFMAGWRGTFRTLKGFDERYFLYCEDVDLSLRAWDDCDGVYLVPSRAVIHDAQRRTLKEWSHFVWHCRSLLTLWTASSFWSYLFTFRDRRRKPRSEPDELASSVK